MTHKQLSDITGVELCADKKTSIDITDKQLFALLQAQHPDAADFLAQHRRGEAMHIPATGDKRAMVREVDDGTRTVEEVARLCGCCERTVERVRAERRAGA